MHGSIFKYSATVISKQAPTSFVWFVFVFGCTLARKNNKPNTDNFDSTSTNFMLKFLTQWSLWAEWVVSRLWANVLFSQNIYCFELVFCLYILTNWSLSKLHLSNFLGISPLLVTIGPTFVVCALWYEVWVQIRWKISWWLSFNQLKPLSIVRHQWWSKYHTFGAKTLF